MPHTAVHLSITRKVFILVLTTSYLLLTVGNIAYGGKVCDTWSGNNCIDPSSSRSGESSDSSSGSGGYTGPYLTTDEMWARRPNLLQSLLYWPIAIGIDFIAVPMGVLDGLVSGGRFEMLSRVAADTWNYCPLVVTARLLTPAWQKASSVSLPSLSFPSLPSRKVPTPEPPRISMKELAQQAIKDGEIARSQGNWSAAERAYRRSIELNPKDWESHAELAHALQMQGSLIAAEHYARQAVELSPENADVRTTLGSILRKQGHDSEAEQQFLTAIKLDPRNPKAEQAVTALVKSQSSEIFFTIITRPAEMARVREAQTLGQSKTAAEQGRLIEILLGTKPDGAPFGFGADLKSADFHDQEALRKSGLEAMSDEAERVFDKPGANKGTLVYPQSTSQRPESSLSKNLSDEAKEDKLVKQFFLWDQQLDSMRTETAQKITTIKEQQKQGVGDAAVQNAQLGTLEYQMETYRADKAETKQRLKEYVTKNLSLPWNESATPDTTEAESK
ncbi:MAG: tetratricopeptide repeat protein [Nitrospira sp.]|nr:MAG: tetratricopeptide repeat protein [Nitrospira sp.]